MVAETWSIVLALAGAVVFLGVLARLGRIPLLYNLRNLVIRWQTSFSTVLAFTLVIALFIFMLAFVRGLLRMTEGSAHPANIMVLSRGATDELVSTISAQEAGADLALQPGILRDANNQPLCSREVYVVVNQIRPGKPGEPTKRWLVQVRGIQDAPIAAQVHGIGPLSAGSWFSEAGVRVLPGGAAGRPPEYAIEAVVGTGFARNWQLTIGDVFEVGPKRWVVVGILPVGGSTFDSEVWAKHQQVAQAFGKDNSFTSLLLRTRDADSARAVAEDLNTNFKKAALHILPETEYYANLAQTSRIFLVFVYVLAAILAVGGVLGVMNTMFASVMQRRKDIAMLRIIGFARWQVLLSFLIEALLLSVVGGALGFAVGSLAHGWSVNSLVGQNRNMAFTLSVDAWSLTLALLFTLTMGAFGGLLPALSTLRVRPLEALRAG